MDQETMTALVGRLDITQLQGLKAIVDARVTEIGTRAFRVGDLVEFNNKAGDAVRATVQRVNVKTLSCKAVAGAKTTNWKVSITLCRLVGADRPTGRIPPSTAPIPVRLSRPGASDFTATSGAGSF